jgi:lysophospholipase L1-like esterase
VQKKDSNAEMKKLIQNISLVIIGVLLAFFLIEGFLRLFNPQIFSIHPRGMYSEDPHVGYILTPDYTGEIVRSEFRVSFYTGSLGLRGTDPKPRQGNTFRILVLGDSLAWGFGVADTETFSAQLQNLLSWRFPCLDIQVLNGGVPGYGTADELAYLHKRGEELHPDLVIVQFLSVNDLEENLTPASEWAAVEDGMLTSHYSTKNTPLAWPEKTRRWLKSSSHAARLLFDVVGYLGTRAGVLGKVDALWGENFSEEEAQAGTMLLVQIAETARELGAAPLFLYTTGQAHAMQELYKQPRSAEIVNQAAQQAQVHWIDSAYLLSLDENKYAFYYPKDGHWTLDGHTAIAKILETHLLDLGLIKTCTEP